MRQNLQAITNALFWHYYDSIFRLFDSIPIYSGVVIFRLFID